MKIRTEARQAYHDKFGTPVAGGGKLSPETLQVWEQVTKLPATEYIVLQLDPAEDLKKARAAIATSLKKLAKTQNTSFIVHTAIHASDHHVVVWKEPKTGFYYHHVYSPELKSAIRTANELRDAYREKRRNERHHDRSAQASVRDDRSAHR